MPPKAVPCKSGDKYGRLTFVKPDPKGKTGRRWICKCDCGKQVSKRSSRVVSGRVKSCGCLRKIAKQQRSVIRVGDSFGRLLVMQRILKAVRWRGTVVMEPFWKCRCTCGRTKIVHRAQLRSGKTKSCGCLQKERSSTHKKSHTPEYRVWRVILCKCTKPGSMGYDAFGGSGLGIEEDWKCFETFLSEVGEKPFEDAALCRKDCDKGYIRGNVYWGKRRGSNPKMITIDGVTHSLAEWSALTSISHSTIKGRLFRGWDPKEAVFGKLKKNYKNKPKVVTEVVMEDPPRAVKRYCDCGKVAVKRYCSDWICQSCADLTDVPVRDVVGVKEPVEETLLTNKMVREAMIKLGVRVGKSNFSDTVK